MDVEYWRLKIKLPDLLCQAVDGRTTSGLEKALARAEESDEDRIAATLLRNFNKVVKALKSMAESNLQRLPLTEVEQYMEVVNSEGLTLPKHMQLALLSRRTRELVAECRYQELFQCMNPWVTEASFDWRSPRLAAVNEADALDKLKTFEKLMVEQVLMDKIYKGDEGKSHVSLLCDEAMSVYATVDVLLLEDKVSKIFREHMCIWKALRALLGNSLDLSGQETTASHDLGRGNTTHKTVKCGICFVFGTLLSFLVLGAGQGGVPT